MIMSSDNKDIMFQILPNILSICLFSIQNKQFLVVNACYSKITQVIVITLLCHYEKFGDFGIMMTPGWEAG